MYIKIWDNKYAIKSDSRQYKLLEMKPKKNADIIEDEKVGDDGSVCIGYFTSLNHLFQEVVEREGRLNKCTTLEGYIKHIEKINDKLEENLIAMAALIGGKEAFERIMSSIPDKIPKIIASLGEGK